MTDPTLFAPVDGGRMSGEIVGQILHLIRSGRLSVGDRLPAERELAASTGVSRVTVRDALRVVEVMGLVEIRVGSSGGAFVTRPSTNVIGENLFNLLVMGDFDAKEIAEARLVMELGILDLAAERLNREDLDDLKAICRQSRELLEAGEHDSNVAISFHRRLAAAAHNGAIEMLSGSFAGPLSLAAIRSAEVRKDANLRTIQEHEKIVAALEAGDPDRARKVMVTHLMRGRRSRKGAGRLVRRAQSD
jgi:GntR family transcriptional regulator, transcriptional repressor for pyruvate dehydrogenase complex